MSYEEPYCMQKLNYIGKTMDVTLNYVISLQNAYSSSPANDVLKGMRISISNQRKQMLQELHRLCSVKSCGA